MASMMRTSSCFCYSDLDASTRCVAENVEMDCCRQGAGGGGGGDVEHTLYDYDIQILIEEEGRSAYVMCVALVTYGITTELP